MGDDRGLQLTFLACSAYPQLAQTFTFMSLQDWPAHSTSQHRCRLQRTGERARQDVNFLPEMKGGTQKGSHRQIYLLDGMSVKEAPKNAVDTSTPADDQEP